jgi:nicotinamide-nucleotide amidase
LAHKANVSSMTACAGLSRRHQVHLKKINLGLDGSSANKTKVPVREACPSVVSAVSRRAGKRGIFPDAFLSRAADLIASCRTRGLTVATAESCTGGLLAALITAIPGSSDVFERGFVTYSNAAKIECLGVSPRILEDFGAVSAEAARAMAAGALAHSPAGIAVSVTGIAGPGGGSPGKPVGLVHFGLARRGGAIVAVEKRFGDLGRDGVRSAAVATAIEMLLEVAG